MTFVRLCKPPRLQFQTESFPIQGSWVFHRLQGIAAQLMLSICMEAGWYPIAHAQCCSRIIFMDYPLVRNSCLTASRRFGMATRPLSPLIYFHWQRIHRAQQTTCSCYTKNLLEQRLKQYWVLLRRLVRILRIVKYYSEAKTCVCYFGATKHVTSEVTVHPNRSLSFMLG